MIGGVFLKKNVILLLICFSLLFFIIGCGGGSKPPTDPPADPILSDSAKKLIPNGDFEKELEGDAEGLGIWFPYTESPATTPTIEWQVDPDDSANHYLYFTASGCGVAQWHQQITPYKKTGVDEFTSCEFVLQSGKEYFISLKAKSDILGGRIHATLNYLEEGLPYYGGLVISTTTEFTTYTKFIGVGKGEKVRFALSLGNLEAAAAESGVVEIINDNVQFYIDDVQLLEQ